MKICILFFLFWLNSLDYFLKMTGMTEKEFDEIADTFRDPRVWWKDEKGEWVKDNLWDV